MEIYMFLFHVENERIFHCVTSYNRKSEILGKQEVIPRNKSGHVW